MRLHQDWEKYDTARVVFRPARMTVEELALRYDWIYRRLFSLGSIWARRPMQMGAAAPYLAMSLVYEKSNRFWHFPIKRRLVRKVWRSLVESTRIRHVRFRKKLARKAVGLEPCFGMSLASGV